VFPYFPDKLWDGVPVAFAAGIVEQLKVMDRFGGRGLLRCERRGQRWTTGIANRDGHTLIFWQRCSDAAHAKGTF
jgi:hypothetical protein